MATIYTNRNLNNYRYQIIGVSCAAIMGSYVLDPWLLNMDGVSNELWRIQDYASDLLVLHIDSTRTINKWVNIDCNDRGNNVVTWASLLFMRERLYRVNTKYFRYGEIFVYAWSLMLCFTSFNKYAITIWTNKINMIIKNNFCFLLCRKDVSNQMQINSEECEHIYGGYCMGNIKFSVIEIMQLEGKIEAMVRTI